MLFKQRERFAAVFKLSCRIMEEQDTAVVAQEPEFQDTEVTQAEVTTEDVVVEEELDVAEDVTPSEKVEEDDLPEEVPDSKLQKEEEIPFTEKPGVKERLGEIEQKYGSKAQYWDSITQLAQEDPAFKMAVLEKLEAAGKVPTGTVKAEREKASSFKRESEYVEQLPEDIRADLLAARQFRQQQEKLKAEQEKKAVEFLTKFESNKPDIAASSNPGRVRSLILNLATQIAERDKIEMASAMESAYKVVMHGGSPSDREVETAIASNQENVAAVASGGVSGSRKLRKLTQEERRAAELAGMTPEEYIKFKDSSDEDLFENI